MPKRGQIQIRKGANLPHWTSEGATYAVTFRLADSLPESAVTRLVAIKDEIERKSAVGAAALSLEELAHRSKAKSEAFQRLLDEGHGACILRDDRVAEVVAGALLHFNGQRYRLHAWCVMPNHVHVVVEPMEGHSLSSILHSWKSFTAHQVNKLLGRAGTLWQRESYDHLIRDAADFHHHVAYVRENPIAAGLKNWKWVG